MAHVHTRTNVYVYPPHWIMTKIKKNNLLNMFSVCNVLIIYTIWPKFFGVLFSVFYGFGLEPDVHLFIIHTYPTALHTMFDSFAERFDHSE